MSRVAYKGGPTNGTVKCPRCGSGRTYEQVLPYPDGPYLVRYLCLEPECRHTWADQVDAYPNQRER